MSEPALNPHTAPRDLAGLMKETPFKLRLLVQALGGLNNEKDKMAWYDLKTAEARGQYALQLVQAWDRANPGAAQPPPPAATNGAVAPAVAAPAPMTMQTPGQALTGFATPGLQPMAPVPAAMMGAPPAVAQVAPGAAAAVAGATSDKPKRQPRTSTSNGEAPAGGDVGLGAEVVNLLNRVVQEIEKNGEMHKAALAKIVSVVEDAADGKNSRVTALEAKHNELQQSLGTLYQMQKITLMAFLTFMENSMGAGMVDILGAAITDSQSFDQLVAKATGKA